MKIHYKPDHYSQQRQKEKKVNIWPVVMAMEAEWYRKKGHKVYWDTDPQGFVDKVITKAEGLPFLDLPKPDRCFSNAFDKKYQNNGNFKHHPGTYIQAASGCWWGKCIFCIKNGTTYQVRPVDDVINEIRECKYWGFKEIFDDSDTFPTGAWLKEFCEKVTPLKVTLGCNMRFGALSPEDYKMMKRAGFRLLLYGLESASQTTADLINKGINVCRAIDEVKHASMLGLEPHVAVMFGYPWEDEFDAEKTLRVVQHLLRKGYAKTAQASLYTVGYTDRNIDAMKYIHKIYHAAFYPDFWINKLMDIRCLDDVKYIWRGIKSCFGK